MSADKSLIASLSRRGAKGKIITDTLSGHELYLHWQRLWPKLGPPGPLNPAIMSVCVRYLIPKYVIPNMSWMRLGAAPETTVLLHSLLKSAEENRTSAESF